MFHQTCCLPAWEALLSPLSQESSEHDPPLGGLHLDVLGDFDPQPL